MDLRSEANNNTGFSEGAFVFLALSFIIVSTYEREFGIFGGELVASTERCLFVE